MRRAARWSTGLVALALAVSCSATSENTGEVSEANTSVCPTMTVEGVDVSDGQGIIDWVKVAAAGRDFAFMKATQGDYNTQKDFPANWAAAKAAGVLRSPYHFFDPTIDGIKQAQHYLTVVDGAGGFQPGDLPPMLDIECPTSGTQASASANCEYTGNSGWVASATLVQRVFDWLATVEQATGRKAIIYSYPSWFATVGLTDPRLADYPLYIASIATCASVPPPWTTAVFWQYSFTGTVSGISATTSVQVDLDRFIGTKGQLFGFANAPIPDAGADASADGAATHGDAAAADAAHDAHAGPGDGSTAHPDGATEGGAHPLAPTAAHAGSCHCRVGGPRETEGSDAPLPLAALTIGLALAHRRRRRRI